MKRFSQVLFLGLVFSGCAVGYAPEDNSAEFVPENTHQCFELLLKTDKWNCGACTTPEEDHACDNSDADDCVAGTCSCGDNPYGNGPELCLSGSDCRFGRCVKTDSDGDSCEMEDECSKGWGCIEGRCSQVCVPEQGKLACNLIDDDCDGCIDGTMGEDGLCRHEHSVLYDVGFVVDDSGSMIGRLSPLKEAVRNQASRYSGDPNVRLGLVRLPTPEADGTSELVTDLTDFDRFETALSGLEQTTEGDEPQYDAVYELGTGELPMSWRPGSNRIIVLITDEKAQSYRSRFGLQDVDEREMCASFMHGETLIVLTLQEFFYDYNDCAMIIELSPYADVLATVITDYAISDPCSN